MNSLAPSSFHKRLVPRPCFATAAQAPDREAAPTGHASGAAVISRTSLVAGAALETAPDVLPHASGADVPFLQDGEAASRLVHTQETAGASPAPATSLRAGGVGSAARETAPADQPKPPAQAGAVIQSRAKTSEDNGRTGAATGAPTAGEVSRGDDAADRQRSALPGFTGEDDGRDVEASGGAASVITLSEASAFILSLVAAHEGKPAGDVLALLIAGAAEAIGIHSLIMRDAHEVDLAELPDFARRAANRFRGGGP